ncbi:MAG TPA: sigma-70 family RNA polymerase sigma factor [Burkholderiaceae bacterium]|nr:sigma-70 family RNA polymerase sigma factor [Burkholderiaceae bacterium]
MSQPFDAKVLQEHTQALYAVALRKVRDPMLAEDLVQETFVAALGAAGERFAGRSSVRTWLVGILKHKIVDAFRESAKAPVSFDEALHSDVHDPLNYDDDAPAAAHTTTEPHGIDMGPEATIARKRFLEACQAQLELLPRQGAQAFLLSDVLGHETQEVCKRLGMTSSNLWTTLHRTRRSLRGALAELRPA